MLKKLHRMPNGKGADDGLVSGPLLREAVGRLLTKVHSKKKHRAWKRKVEEEDPVLSLHDPKERLAEQLQTLGLAYEHGNLGAIVEALLLCACEDKMRFAQPARGARPLPRWLVLALMEILKDHLCRRRGKRPSWINLSDPIVL